MATSTFWLKACPRCGGDLREVQDIEGAYVMCVQCGHELRADEERSLRTTGVAQVGRPLAVGRRAA